MRIVEPSVYLLRQAYDELSHVAQCARICYGRESGNDVATYASLLKRNHLSMLRHETYYAAVPVSHSNGIIYKVINNYMENPYIKYFTLDDKVYIITNGNFIQDIKKSNPILLNLIISYRISFDEAARITYLWSHFIRYTFIVNTQISTSRELNRVSPNNIAERSTRYVYEDGSICRPHWMSIEEANRYNIDNIVLDVKTKLYIESCKKGFDDYKTLVDDYKMHRQDARGVLPLDTLTKCAYTYSIDEWRHIIDLRYYNTTGVAHPNASIIAGKIRNSLINIGYNFRNNNNDEL
nr:MAG TPA: Thymidylate synthase complementing protein [Crassvirales sp.]